MVVGTANALVTARNTHRTGIVLFTSGLQPLNLTPAANRIPPGAVQLANYVHSGYTRTVNSDVESLLPLPPAAFHILVALADEDRHGYAVIKDVAARTGGALQLSPGTLYRSIDRMVQQGLIREISTRPAKDMDDERRRYYRITPFGREVAMAECRRLAQMLDLARKRGLAPRKA